MIALGPFLNVLAPDLAWCEANHRRQALKNSQKENVSDSSPKMEVRPNGQD